MADDLAGTSTVANKNSTAAAVATTSTAWPGVGGTIQLGTGGGGGGAGGGYRFWTSPNTAPNISIESPRRCSKCNSTAVMLYRFDNQPNSPKVARCMWCDHREEEWSPEKIILED